MTPLMSALAACLSEVVGVRVVHMIFRGAQLRKHHATIVCAIQLCQLCAFLLPFRVLQLSMQHTNSEGASEAGYRRGSTNQGTSTSREHCRVTVEVFATPCRNGSVCLVYGGISDTWQQLLGILSRHRACSRHTCHC